MEFDALTEGVKLGGLRNKNEIKILICYIFEQVQRSLSIEDIINIVQITQLANYFECTEAFNDLIQKGNLELAKDCNNKYILTQSGYLIASQLESELPRTVKDKALGTALIIENRAKADKENKVEIKETTNGYNVICYITDGDINLCSFSLYVPNEDQARIVKRNFQDSPTLVYNVIIASVTQNKDLIQNALENI